MECLIGLLSAMSCFGSRNIREVGFRIEERAFDFSNYMKLRRGLLIWLPSAMFCHVTLQKDAQNTMGTWGTPE